jgi:hypothetical protein
MLGSQGWRLPGSVGWGIHYEGADNKTRLRLGSSSLELEIVKASSKEELGFMNIKYINYY